MDTTPAVNLLKPDTQILTVPLISMLLSSKFQQNRWADLLKINY